jgi:hypothetical protein
MRKEKNEEGGGRAKQGGRMERRTARWGGERSERSERSELSSFLPEGRK